MRDEAVLREEGERRMAKEIVAQQAALQTEQANREEAVLKVERRVVAEVAIREEAQTREAKEREEADAKILAAWQKALREESLAREDDRKDIAARLQQDQREQQQERDDRTKADRELSASIARIQSLLKEEEESRVEQGERLGAAVESLQDAVRVLGPQREEILKSCMEAIDKVQSGLNKEIVARSTKSEALEEAVRDVRSRLSDEVQQREAADRQLSEALVDEKQQREEALLRERRAAEEEVQQALQQTRKAREDEERAMQNKVLEISSAVSEERDLRQEAIRQERQRLVDAKDEFHTGQKGVDREVAKLAGHMSKQFDADARRAKDVDVRLADLLDRCDTTRGDLAGEAQRRETEIRNLEQHRLELQGLLANEMKERQDMDADLRKDIAMEVQAREASVDGERLSRESGDLQGASQAKAATRDEREAREAEAAQTSKELVGIKALISEETGRREDERSQQHVVIQKIKADLSELHGERKVDVVAMREAFGQVTEELKVAQRARKEDVDRLDATLGTISSRVDGNARTARDQCFALEQQLQGTHSEMQKDVDERVGSMAKLEARITEEHRFVEAQCLAEAKLREESVRSTDEAGKQRLAEESRKHKVAIEKVAGQVGTLAEDIEKDRQASSDHARDVARSVAVLQGSIASEEQARQQNGWHLQQSVDLAREEIATEAKERRAQCASLAEDATLLQRGLQKRDDRSEALGQQLNAESNDLRERIVRESRLRETAVQQLEQTMANGTLARGSVPSSQALALTAAGPSSTEFNEYRRTNEEDKEKTRRTLTGLQGEQQALNKAIDNVADRYDQVRAGLSATQASLAEVQTKQKTFVEMEQQVILSRDELRKEAQERRTEDERLAAAMVETDQRLERSEQQRVKSDNSLRQEVLEAKAAQKKEARDRELADTKLATLLREEGQQREETAEREGRLRQEGQERTADAFHAAIREERRVREKEDLRLEGRSLAPVGSKSDGLGGGSSSLGDSSAITMEQRSLRQGMADITDRLGQAEARQRNAEERTVSMLDAIMSGLTGPDGHHDQ